MRGQSLLELQELVADALRRHGVPGEVEITEEHACLGGPGPAAQVDLGPLVLHWEELPSDIRRRRAAEIARQLAALRRQAAPATARSPRHPLLEWALPLGLMTAGVTALFLTYAAFRFFAGGGNDVEAATAMAATAAELDAYERERRDRARRVCEATRSRVMRGALVGPSDVEGWVVEAAFLRSAEKPDPLSEPALASFVAPADGNHRLVWAGSAELVSRDGPDTRVLVGSGDISGTDGTLFRGARLTFTGRYVIPYFDARQRASYVRLAAALAEALEAEYGALYARCADGRMHHLGGWFLGHDPGAALAAVVYYMGVFADVPHVRSSVLYPKEHGEVDHAHAFRRIATAMAPLAKPRVATLLGTEGGMLSSAPTGSVIIQFPFRDANRASRASRQVALELGIGEVR